jgi:hypothetical protein
VVEWGVGATMCDAAATEVRADEMPHAYDRSPGSTVGRGDHGLPA